MAIKIKVKPKAKPFPEIPDPFGYGQRAVDYIRSLKHPKSKLPGGRFQLDPWQEEIIRRIYGPRHPDGSRIVRNVVLLIPRGNRKTTLSAALAMLHGKGPEATPGGEILSAAADRHQAKLVFNEVAGLIDPDHAFAANVGNSAKSVDQRRGAKLREYRNRIIFENGTVLECLSSDGETAQGRTPNLVLADELHAWQKRDPRALWAALRAGANKVDDSLVVVTTTAGRGSENLCFDVVSYARKVLKGEIDDPGTLPILYEADRDCDWRDEKVWHAVNPGLAHGYPSLPALRQYAKEAEQRPSEVTAFKRFHLNIWSDHSASPFVDMAVYDEGKDPVDLQALKDEPCWIGVDLGRSVDHSAVVACWKVDGVYHVWPHYFVPAEGLEKRSITEGVDYQKWAADGLITAVPGHTVDPEEVEQHVRDLCQRFHVEHIGFDPWSAKRIMHNLLEDNLPVIEVRQGWATLSPMIQELERAIVARKFRHGGHPILRWNFDSIRLEVSNTGNRSFHKAEHNSRIDGAVAAAMAVGLASTVEEETSIYESEDFDVSMVVF